MDGSDRTDAEPQDRSSDKLVVAILETDERRFRSFPFSFISSRPGTEEGAISLCIEILFFSEGTDEGKLSSDGIGVEDIVNLSSLVVLSDEHGASRDLVVLAPLPVPLEFDGVFIRPPPPFPRCRA
jgi:hypothetical protein